MPDRRSDQRKRLDEVFGDVFEQTSSDERDDRDRAESAEREEWLQQNRPPHW